ncbi:hypothetical protein C8J56DRAFT_390341 [Mycena floridula]|nr:hypothetical protein C8J56DRAFT_390341 [Mycena floridula]
MSPQRSHLVRNQTSSSSKLRNSLDISRAAMGRKQSIQQYHTRLAKENVKRMAEKAQVEGVQAMWITFQNTIAEEEKKYPRLEES